MRSTSPPATRTTSRNVAQRLLRLADEVAGLEDRARFHPICPPMLTAPSASTPLAAPSGPSSRAAGWSRHGSSPSPSRITRSARPELVGPGARRPVSMEIQTRSGQSGHRRLAAAGRAARSRSSTGRASAGGRRPSTSPSRDGVEVGGEPPSARRRAAARCIAAKGRRGARQPLLDGGVHHLEVAREGRVPARSQCWNRTLMRCRNAAACLDPEIAVGEVWGQRAGRARPDRRPALPLVARSATRALLRRLVDDGDRARSASVRGSPPRSPCAPAPALGLLVEDRGLQVGHQRAGGEHLLLAAREQVLAVCVRRSRRGASTPPCPSPAAPPP